ncbi:TPA: helix-turn-helix domain-containing protein [Pseudomonas aeruginosa]|nr:helix-turn-helix domain-containing protein [Pseudomonas aeruginosa]HEJ3645592.1 helix-turn-helix domain-containing protein [Pseudomonas aeruginosa]HEJ4458764.1 helix-turn-helix domain-containing protein [Pseudomonas aeruginosa]HEJ6025753.1 helix-turn-helix domain-containing protein [Pseudomonas aeruginosa]HEK3459884.1 helix-turn-helix domain-containing protein [Pseudomonas aeruginosa]
MKRPSVAHRRSEVARMVREGHRRAAIAQALGVPSPVVSADLAHLGLRQKPRRPLADQHALVVRLLEQGSNGPAIAKRLGVTRQAVHAYLQAHGLLRTQRRIP